MWRSKHTGFAQSILYKVLFFSLLLCGGGKELCAQFYPIHATVQWPSPQSPHLVDYYSGSRDRLIITLHNRDLQQPLLLARLRLQIKSNGFLAQTREELSYPMLELMAGIPTRLTATDLMPYLRPENLTINGRLRNGQFPTGFTEISVQVVDYYSKQVLSSWHTARAYLDSKQPPILNLPQRDEQVAYRDPLFIRFQWYPRHQGLAGTEYEFVLKELPDNGAAPQAAFAYGNEIYRTRTRHTTLNYTHLEPILLPNRRYAWQVQAIARDGVDEVGMFEHGGFSEIYWFTLNENCPVPTGLKADPRYAKVDFSWNRVVGATGYMLACRPKTSKDIYEWSEVQSYSERMTLAQLKPGWTYEWRVGTLCTGDKPIYSAIQEVTLPKTNLDLLRDCGKEPPRANLSPDPALDIQVGDTVTIGGDYPMVITQLQSLGDGWYSGRGTTRLSSIIELPRVALRFDRLRINIEKCQIDGLVEAIYADQPGGIADLDKIDDGGKRIQPSKLRIRERKIDFALGEMPEMSFDPETGELEVTDAEGKLQRIKLDLPEGGESASAFPMIITDSKGDSYQLSPAESSEVSSSGASSTSSPEGRVGTKQGLKVERVDKIGSFDESRLAHGIDTVRFEPSAQARYAFDSGTESWYQRSVKLDEYYKPFAKGYIAPWKLIPTGELDVVAARYEGKKSIDLSRVRFATSPNSPTLPAELHEESKTWSLKLPATDAQSSYDVYAVYEGEVIGKLRVVSFPKQRHKLTLVPISDAKLDKAQIERELNSIYNSVGIHFDVEVDARMRGDYSWDRDDDGKLSIVGKSFFGRVREVKESAEMEYLKKAYTQLAGTLDGVYLFVVDAAGGLEAQPKDLLGEMPRRSRFGYIFSGNSPNGGTSDLGYTIAHELGHGLFTLQHTFDDEYGGRKSLGQTDNLMDYAAGKELAAFQWNVISNPAVFTAADNKSQGDLVRREQAYVGAKNGGITPDGKVILSVKATNSSHIATLTIIPGSYYVHGITLSSKEGEPLRSYSWDKDKKTYASGSALIEDALDLELTYNSTSKKVTTRLYRVASGEKCLYQYHDVTYDPTDPSSLNIPKQGWITDYLWAASESCKAEFIARTILANDRLSYDEDQIERDILKLRQLSEKTSYEDLLQILESCHIKSLKRQSYEWLIRTLKRVARKETLKEREELAILRLMQSIDGKDYSQFYRDLEADQNALLLHLVAEIDDVSLYFWIDKDNYTNFIGALVWMFNADGGKSIKERFPQDPDDYARIVLNLTPVKYGSVQLMGGGDASFTEKYNQGEYISSTGVVKLLDVYKTYTTTRNSLHSREHREELGIVSPLTPIIIVPDTDNLPLIETALGGNTLSDQMYVVPAIFMKYRADKIRNDNIEKGVVTAFDVATIAFSGGTALATKVHWIRRAWALAEVVGAVGNIAVNTQAITSPELKSAVDIYNTAMGIIGLKNAGQAGYKFIKNLPEQSKKLLQENKALGSLLVSKYLDWKRIVSPKIDGLSLAEKQLLSQQEEVFRILGSSLDPEWKFFKPIKGGGTFFSSKFFSKEELAQFVTFQVNLLLGKLKTTKTISPSIKAELRKILSGFSPEVLDKLLHIKGVDIVLNDMAQSWRKLQGGKFQLQYFANHLAEGTSIVQFEVKEEVKIGKETVARTYDIVTEKGMQETRYELKNWSSWGSWSDKAFRQQFLKDLATMAEGKRVQWVFSGHKMSREELKRAILASLREPAFRQDLKEALPTRSHQEIVKGLLGIEPDQKIDLIQALERDEVFDVVFEIIQ